MYKIKSKQGLLTSQDRVVAQIITSILNEVSNWTLPAEERIKFEETISGFARYRDGWYEVERVDIFPFYDRLMSLYADEIGL